MIQVFGSDKSPIGLFKDYDALFKHINAIENTKFSEGTACYLGDVWGFALYTNKRLSYIYHKTLERSFSKIGKEAFEQELDLIEIYKGDFKNPVQIPVTPDVNVQELKENWCHEYCDTHNYLLVDYRNNFENHTSIGAIPVANIAHGMNGFAKESNGSAHASY
jgi:hypothetical protein